MFAVSEIMDIVTRNFIIEDHTINCSIKRCYTGFKKTFNYKKTIFRSATMGTLIGVIPAAGASIASLISYSYAKRVSKFSRNFGKGEPDGLIAAETANNASEGGAMSTLLALGIPGSSATAILIGAFMLQGLIPGPRLLIEQGPLVYGLIFANMLQMVLLGLFAILIAFYVSRIVFFPTGVIVPTLIVIMAMGSFCIRSLLFDAYLFYFFGFLGWILKRYDFPIVSFIIGFILADSLDMQIYQFHALFGSDISVMLKRPIPLTLIIISACILLFHMYRNFQNKKTESN